MELKIRRIGGSLGVILPKKIINDLDVSAGDFIYISHSQHGFMLLSHDPESVEAIKVGEEFIKKRKNVLKALA